ncbi:3-hydroxyisobutyryl-CoA hydrolase-like protein 3, mitochondrial [Labeo rohita]|uniref:3-hydroxyisobutyryl-CoA hydrolase-like protein 3, mitochondrial n=1 Tax=Labeo rohita TaxID=84645 RepID=A0ABQ8L1R0_LABRO|nr:3-hydroxyisobutyryl-CoA hydrolase-like protein 3, mitochondrial [Labeo rohita]KAI2646509.1 3-hydroxyisobutyryl-CoA hydrolase-like protein 3, mitochondrial [Labeo rohita]KAI2655877.1 3-hydroxyisobutyryl-CoA hydrolase-like protein 3, mitochondrial [Labeo rohita]
MLMKSRHTVVWCRHSCSQIVPHILSCAGFCVLGFRWVIGRILHNLCINNVPVLKTEVVEHCTASNNFWHKCRAHFQGLEEDGPPACLQHPEGSFNNVACMSMLGVEASLYRILYRLSVRGDEADGRTQTGIPTISEDAFSCRWI